MVVGTLRFLSLVCAVSCIVGPPAQAQKPIKDIVYTTGPEGAERGDFYAPPGSGPFPAIVYIHGGSWRSGNKNTYRKLASDLAAHGYAGFAIDYDLHPHAFPTSVEEAQSAVRFLRSHAAEYHIDPDRILVAGDSAGGQIAALVALAPSLPGAGETAKANPAAPDRTPATVSGAIIFNGVFRMSTNVGVIARYLGIRCESQPDVCKAASPLEQISPAAPAFFVGHGTSDRLVPYAEAQLFIHALQQQHVPVSTYAAAGGPHSYWKKGAFYGPNLAAVESFLAGPSTAVAQTRP